MSAATKPEPLCDECGDTGGHDGEAPCHACALGAVHTYAAERDYGRIPFRLGTLDEYLDEQVSKYGRVNNRSVSV